MSVHRYPPQSLVKDYTYAGGGLLASVAVLYWGPGTVIAIAFVILAALCAFFVVRTVDRNRAVVSLDDETLTMTSFQTTRVRWADLARMTLFYYSTKRDKSDAWMELTLKDTQATIKLDSRLEGFLAIVVKAARVARERRIPLNQITLSNLKALKITGE
jgi:hypothetical protein